ncbi:hypothetical protein RRG08_004635 [Elysia crispata]|uniref:Uncharacterized protein n=1 Tax=Elysia crispata TaxID=231223 RepID=A0AAE1CX45_9GAST|nr:hypothetical protein RRG08_004635 [Elysia crispata]
MRTSRLDLTNLLADAILRNGALEELRGSHFNLSRLASLLGNCIAETFIFLLFALTSSKKPKAITVPAPNLSTLSAIDMEGELHTFATCPVLVPEPISGRHLTKRTASRTQSIPHSS